MSVTGPRRRIASITPPGCTGRGFLASLDGNGSVGASDLLAEGGINEFVNSQQTFARATPWILAMLVGRADIGMLYLVRSVGSVGGALLANKRSSTLLR